MSGANSSSRLSKRSRASDAAQNQIAHTDEYRTKRRRFSQRKNEGEKESELPVSRVLQESTVNDDHVSVGDGIQSRTLLKTGESSSTSWSLSQIGAGQYSNLDPVLTSDEEYLFVAVETAIHVYSTTTSHLVRTLQTQPNQSIIGYKLCPINQEHIYVFTSTGSISEWEWSTGKQTLHWDSCRKTSSIDIIDASEDDSHILFYSLCERKGGRREIRVSILRDGKPLETVVLETDIRVSHIRTAQQGRAVVAYGGQHLLFGVADSPNLSSVEHVQYTWRETSLPVNITCLDIRENTRQSAQDTKDRKASEQLDLAVGEASGSILIYQDVLSFFVNYQDIRDGGKGFAPRRLHWHRGPVNALRWSRDGNYIISGGNESVIVLWQLDTGRKQFLPHLSSPICNIVVSRTGNSYAVKLADNCVMVLSARELQPYATVIGLQVSPKTVKPRSQFGSNAWLPCGTTTAVLHPQYPDQLLVAVPAFRHVSQDGHCPANSPVIQTYNIHTNNHISRQALARTNTSVLKISPEGSEITTPDIKFLDISQDGTWMATVDCWSPPPQDMKALGLNNAGDGRATDHEETFLKFWKWSSSSSLWELVTRIDGPHFSDNGPAPVLGLASRPRSNEFVTIGTDAVLRVWYPNPRPRSGLKTDTDAMQQLETWKCRNIVDLKGSFGPNKPDNISAACLAFSEDGSVLAVCLPSMSASNPGLVLLLDAQKCTIHYSRVGAYSGDPCAVRFLGRHLIVASKRSVSVWDTVDDLVRVPTSLVDGLSAGKPQPLLAVSPKTRTFAIAVQNLQRTKRSRIEQFHIQVYDIESLSPVFSFSVGKCPFALLSDPRSGDYIIVDVGANVQRFGCSDRIPQVTARPYELTSRSHTGLVDLFGSQGPVLQQSTTLTSNTDKVPSLHEGLPGVFGEVPSFVLPPASVLFRNVVKSLPAM